MDRAGGGETAGEEDEARAVEKVKALAAVTKHHAVQVAVREDPGWEVFREFAPR